MKRSRLWRRYILFFFVAVISIGIITIFLFKAYDYYNRQSHGVAENVFLEGINMEGYLPQEVSQIVELLALETERKPQNAELTKRTGEISQSKAGLIVDQESTIGLVLYSPPNTNLNLITYIVEPAITTEELKKTTKVLGAYTTYFAGSPQRYQNIKLAISAINNTIVKPKHTFSFNLTTGPRTLSKGYQPAPVIIGGNLALGIGGGVCQVSSTLYNAVRKSNLEVLERHGHSKPVRYVPPNMDAAVAEGHIDFKFKNTKEELIIVKAAVEGAKISIWILGREG
ncbi:MAG: VanW family protein [Bacillota bacterium]|nr:VanW family protein [Bacillota bacterium]